MLDTILAHLRVWSLKHDTVRYLSNCDDRMLADMGIDRANIANIARRNARADKRLARNAAVPAAERQHKCGVTA